MENKESSEQKPRRDTNGLRELLKFGVAAAAVYGVSWCVMSLEQHAIAALDGLTQEAQARERIEPKKSPGVRDYVAEISRANGVDPKLVESVIEQESNWRSDAMRFEPGVARDFNSRGVRDDEVTALSTSFGLMQVIYGFHGERCGLKSATELFDPRVNVRCGVAVLRTCFSRSNDVRRALVCYNGGSKCAEEQGCSKAEEYADEVLKRLANKMVG